MPTEALDRVARRLLITWAVAGAAAMFTAFVPATVCPYLQWKCDLYPSFGFGQTAFVVVVVAAGLGTAYWRRRAREVIPLEVESHPSSRTKLLGFSALGVLLSAHLLMLAPPMQEEIFCATPVHLNRHMRYTFNCDSELFMRLAHAPSEILEPGHVRQSRPGYVWLSAAATTILGPVADAVGLDRAYGQEDDAYVPMVLINLLIAAAAIALLAWLLRSIGTSLPITVALCAIVAINDVTKSFYWTPHMQMFVLLVPVGAVAGARWVLLKRPSWRAVGLLGLGLGVLSLVYGSVLIIVAAMGAALFFDGYRRAIKPLAALAISAVLPVLAWILVARLVAGSFFSHETSDYHQFVWIVEGSSGYIDRLTSYTLFTVEEIVEATGLIVLTLVGLGTHAIWARVDISPSVGSERSTISGAFFAILSGLAFCWALGYYAVRMGYYLVPALLVLVGWMAARIGAKSRPGAMVLNLGLPSLVTLWVFHEVTKLGPYV